ncbi:MAG: sulfotransferase family protein [Saprospiraceae bacterium]|nr:sulfotransferase family protein [Saprospiraceae bacterium]
MKNWIPNEIKWPTAEGLVNWLFIGEQRFRSPFFEESLAKCRRLPENAGPIRRTTSLAGLESAAAVLETVAPTAFIFHVSRCGSTMLTQSLSLRDDNIVVAEAPIFDAILRWKYNAPDIPELVRHHTLKKAVHLLGQRRFNETHYFIKWDSWHLLFLDEIREIYPNVPFILLNRNLEKVKLSLQKMPGMQVVQGLLEPEIYGLTKAAAMELHPTEYTHYVLTKMQRALFHFLDKDDNSLLLEYEDGVFNNFMKAIDFIDLEYHETELNRVGERLQFHSKKPDEQFVAEP